MRKIGRMMKSIFHRTRLFYIANVSNRYTVISSHIAYLFVGKLKEQTFLILLVTNRVFLRTVSHIAQSTGIPKPNSHLHDSIKPALVLPATVHMVYVGR